MAKLVFVTGPTTSGKTRYIQEHGNERAVGMEEAQNSRERLTDIDDWLRAGHDVYVSWIPPEGTTIEWVDLG